MLVGDTKWSHRGAPLLARHHQCTEHSAEVWELSQYLEDISIHRELTNVRMSTRYASFVHK